MKSNDEISSLRVENRALRNIKDDLAAANVKLRMENARLKEELHIAEVTKSEFNIGYYVGMTFSQSRILDLLMRHDCVSRALIEHTLYYGRVVQSTKVDAHLRNIRIALDALKITLHNDRGHGWSLLPEDKARLRAMTRDKTEEGESTECRSSA